MNVLIIGATGLLAKPVIKKFTQEGFDLTLFSRSIQADKSIAQHKIVQGDVFNPNDLRTAMTDCDAVHITISKVDEGVAVRTIVAVAKEMGIKKISYVSGNTVKEEHRWFEMIDQKIIAEQAIKDSDIEYIIFRPTWFFDTAASMIKDGKAMIIGKNKYAYHWIAADDFANMIVNAYLNKEAWNQTFPVLGKTPMTLKEVMTTVAQSYDPPLKVTTIPIGMIKFMGMVTKNPGIKFVANMFAYFEKVQEYGDAQETWDILGEPQIELADWLANRGDK